MTNLLSDIHKYLTNKNTKKGQKVRKKLSLRERSHFLPLKTGTALSPQAKAVQHPAGSRFFEMISFFLHSVSANLMIAKKRGNARKTPEIVRFRGFEAMISFLASLYGCGGGTCNHRIARKCVRSRLFGAARSHPTRRGGSEVIRRLDFVSKKGTASMRMLFLFWLRRWDL